MSTMYDALRKAEAERQKGSSQAQSSAGMPENVKVLILLALVVCVFGFAYYRFTSSKIKTVAAPVVQPGSGVTTAANIPPPRLKPQRAPGTYGLDGLIEAGDASMAIVNDRLLKIGQSIDHLMLKSVSSKQAELLNTKDNSTLILKFN